MKLQRIMFSVVSVLLTVLLVSVVAETASAAFFRFYIDISPGYEIGKTAGAEVYFDGDGQAMIDGVDLLLYYNATSLTLDSVVADGELETALSEGWELFRVEQGGQADCGGDPCPEGTIRITARADGNGDGVGSAFVMEGVISSIVDLYFHVAPDSQYMCDTAAVGFIWYSCGDNTAHPAGSSDSLFLSARVFGIGRSEITGDFPFPTFAGAPALCDAAHTERTTDFYSGFVQIACPDTGIMYGDVNNNGAPFEIADLILYANYFIYGSIVFSDFYGSFQLLRNTDANQDGFYPTLDDMFYIIRTIMAETLPDWVLPLDTAIVQVNDGTGEVTLHYPDSMVGMYLALTPSVALADLDPGLVYWTPEADTLHPPWSSVMVGRFDFDNLPTFTPTPPEGLHLFTCSGPTRIFRAEASYDGVHPIPVRVEYTNMPPCCLLRGDADNSGTIAVGDLMVMVNAVLLQGSVPPCPEQADVDASGQLNIADIVALAGYMFRDFPAPPACE